MATTITINDGNTAQVDLGNSNSMSITAAGGTATVYVDYQNPAGSGNYSSAIKGSAGYGNPFSVASGATKVVNKSDLESEHVRVDVTGANITVVY